MKAVQPIRVGPGGCTRDLLSGAVSVDGVVDDDLDLPSIVRLPHSSELLIQGLKQVAHVLSVNDFGDDNGGLGHDRDLPDGAQLKRDRHARFRAPCAC